MQTRYLQRQFSTVGLVAHYKLWAGLTAATTVFDYSLNGNTGTVANALPSYPGFNFVATDTDNQITLGNLGTIKTGMFWFRPNNGTQQIIQINGDPDSIAVVGNELSALGDGFSGSATLYVDGVEGINIVVGRWNLAAFTQAGQAFGDTILGNVNTVGWYDGKIGDVMMFDVIKSAAEIRSIYELTKWRYGV